VSSLRNNSASIKLAPLALVSVAAAWGLAFVLMKDSLTEQPVNDFLASRFIVATLAMLAMRPTIIKYFTKDLVLRGAGAGFFLGMGYIFQTYGLSHTTAAITGFVTGLYVVFTPLIAALLLKKRIPTKAWIAVLIATIGLAFLSLEGFSISFGAILVLISAIFFAAHIVSLGEWSAGRDVYAMTIIQLAMCGLLTTLGAIPDGFMLPPSSKVWWVVVFTAICGTAIAFVIQTWAQSVMTPTTVAVLLTTETVWAALFAVAVGGETLTFRIIVGGLLVIFAMYQIIILDSKESA